MKYVEPQASAVKNDASYMVGADATALVKNAKAGDTLTLLQYDSEITVPEGVKIDNETGGPVTINGNTLESAQQLTTTHNTVATDAKEATCTEAGNIAYWYCTICDKYYRDAACTQEITPQDTVIPAKGHGETELQNAREATCTAEGYTGDKVCKNCGEVVEAGKITVRRAHTYQDGKCTVCGAADPGYNPGVQPGVPTDTGKTVPKTGDNSPIALYLVLMLTSAVGLTGLALSSRKRKSNP